MAGRASAFLSFKYGTGDVIAQRAAFGEEEPDEFDRRRAALFYGFGGYYGVIFYSVVKALSWVPIPNPWTKAVFSACFDGFVHVPFLFLPQFYFFKEVVTCPEERCADEHLRVGLQKWRSNYASDALASAGVFIPLGIINFR